MDVVLIEEWLEARKQNLPCALVTVAAASGSVPRAAGAKMLVYESGKTSGTVGGGRFEALVIQDALEAIRNVEPVLKTFPLREDQPGSFGAICGGSVTVLIEPQKAREALCIIGAGHCAQALARLAAQCGISVTVLDDRPEFADAFPPGTRVLATGGDEFLEHQDWSARDAVVLVGRNYAIDREALFVLLQRPLPGYIGMIGSRRKVLRVFDELRRRGVPDEQLGRVHAPIGLDIGADSPAEIAVSILAEVLAALRGCSAKPLGAGEPGRPPESTDLS